ncbi:vacuolar protein-sorting-associated protein 25 [Atheta coriaria]|uniref:vacuolar protein-sorting-associated protein 25 n=1 Tax=Dalotia coriaria TaxID=877792 RepID=UPI0031F46F61
MGEVDIEWPWQYNFPPFFTLQTHSDTRAKQLVAWKALVLNYCKTQKICFVDTRETKDISLFSNASINRTIQADLLNLILSELQQTGYSAPLDKQKLRWEIYWHTLEEFANIIYSYITDSNSTQTVLTFYELTEGDEVQGQDFYKLAPEILIKVLKVLEDQGKCEMIMFDDNQGVKFF